MKRLIVFIFLLLVGITFFVVMIFQTGPQEIWTTLRQFKLLHFGGFIFLSLLNFMLYTLRWHIIIKKTCVLKLSFWQLFMHRMSGFAVSYITPSAQTGGEPLRVMLLHKEGVPNKKATSSVIIDKGLEFAALFIFIGVGMAIALFQGSLPDGMRIVFEILLVALIALVFWFYYSSVKNIGFFSSILRITRLNRFKKIKTLEENIKEVENEMSDFYKKYSRVFILLVAISIIITSFLLLEHWMVARFMGVNLTFLQTFLVSTIPYIAYMIPIPGGIGILEGGHAAMFAVLGISINAFVLVLIIRIRDLFFVFIGLVHASKNAVQMLKKAFTDKNNC